jgi:hypothetical protein
VEAHLAGCVRCQRLRSLLAPDGCCARCPTSRRRGARWHVAAVPRAGAAAWPTRHEEAAAGRRGCRRRSGCGGDAGLVAAARRPAAPSAPWAVLAVAGRAVIDDLLALHTAAAP